MEVLRFTAQPLTVKSRVAKSWLIRLGMQTPHNHSKSLISAVPSLQVPAAVSHSEFWHRYFYKVHQLEQVCWPSLGRYFTQPWGKWAGFCGGKKGIQDAKSSGVRTRVWEEGALTAPGHLLPHLIQEQARRDALKQRAEQSISEEPGWEEEEGKNY